MACMRGRAESRSTPRSRYARPTAQYRWLLSRRVPLRDEAGKVIRWYGIELRHRGPQAAEEELRRSEAFLAEGQRLSSTGTFSWRVDTDELTFSDELYRIFELDQHAPA